jgi:arsenite-transporting ATPase
MEIIKGWQDLASECMTFLRRDVRFSMVVIPEALAVRQLDGVVHELPRYALGIGRLIVNNVLRVIDSPLLKQKMRQQQPHVVGLRERYRDVPIIEVPLFPQEVRGVERLRAVGQLLAGVEPLAVRD